MSRLRNWLAEQYWEREEIVIFGIIFPVLGLGLSALLALLITVVRFGAGHDVVITAPMFWSSWLIELGFAAPVGAAIWIIPKLPDWARKKPPQQLRDYVKEEALRELDDLFPADKEEK